MDPTKLNSLIGLIYPLANRVVNEEERIPVSDSILQVIQEHIHKYQNLTEGLDLSEPSTALNLVDKLIEKNIDEGPESISDLISKMGVEEYDKMADGLLEDVIMNLNAEVLQVFDNGSFLAKVEEGVYLTYEIKEQNLYLNTDIPKIEQKVDHLVRNSLWENSKNIQITTQSSGDWSHEYSFTFADFQLDTTDYIGPLENLQPKVKKMFHSDHRWCLLVQGKPGVGKTTFMHHVIRQLDGRFIFFPKRTFGRLEVQEWTSILAVMKPDIILLDDVDYLREDQLEARMNAVAEDKIDTPLILMTSNSLEAFPSAMKRPGRIDHVEIARPPREKYVHRMFQAKAAEFDVEVPEDSAIVNQLKTTLWDGSPAHLREVLKRASVWGWDDEKVFDVYIEEESVEGGSSNQT